MNRDKAPRILEVLRKYSDENHSLKQKEIIELLKKEYDLEIDRKTLGRYLADFRCDEDFFPIEQKTFERSSAGNGNGDPIEVHTSWYYNHEFSEDELHLLIDLVRASGRTVSGRAQNDLVEKIANLSTVYFADTMKKSIGLGPKRNASENQELFGNFTKLEDAISRDRQVTFHYLMTDDELKLTKKQKKSGGDRNYTVSPYLIVPSGVHHYLVAAYAAAQETCIFRLDRIKDLKIKEDHPRRPLAEIPGYGRGIDTVAFMAERPYMFAGKSVSVTFRVKREEFDSVMDWFASGTVRVIKKDAASLTLNADINPKAMRCLALQYCTSVEILTPADMRTEVAAALASAAAQYQNP